MCKELVIGRIRDFFTDALAADVFPLTEAIRFCRELEPLLLESTTLETRGVALGDAITSFLSKYPATDKPDYRELPTLQAEIKAAAAEVAKVQADLDSAKAVIAKLEAEKVVETVIVVEEVKEPIVEEVPIA